MKIYIEGLVILTLLFMFFTWIIWYKWSERRLLKKYKPENDKGRKGTEPKTEEREFAEPTIDNVRHGEPEGREFLQETITNNDGEDSKRNRKIRFIRK